MCRGWSLSEELPRLESLPDRVTAYHWSRHPTAPPSFSSFLPFFHSSILFFILLILCSANPHHHHLHHTHTHQCLIHFPSTGLCAPWFICLWSLLTLSNTFLFFPSSPSSPSLFWQSLWVLRGISMTSLSPHPRVITAFYFLSQHHFNGSQNKLGFFCCCFDLISVKNTVNERGHSGVYISEFAFY